MGNGSGNIYWVAVLGVLLIGLGIFLPNLATPNIMDLFRRTLVLFGVAIISIIICIPAFASHIALGIVFAIAAVGSFIFAVAFILQAIG